tara:strand:+ start:377 stop:601 length:225 start_codon:yes stop_codon:yes gene_type:complete
MGISQKIAALLEKRHNIEKEIAKLQKSCKHSVKSIKQIRENVDSTSPSIRYVCNGCALILGYPTQQEKNNFLKE